MANVSTVQQLSTKVRRQEVLSDSAWHSFLIVMLWVGGLATLGWLVWLGYYWGSSGCYTCTQNKPPVAAVVIPPASPTQAETAAIAELEKARLAIEKMMADTEQKATAQATASAAATTMVVAPPPPKTERRVPTTKQVEPACPCPPAESVKVPAPTLSSAERRRNEMWSALQR